MAKKPDGDNIMNSVEFMEAVADKAGEDISSYRIKKIVALMADVLNENLEKGITTRIAGIGTVAVKPVPERKARNIQTGEEITVPVHNSVKITPVRKFKDSAKASNLK